MLKAKLVVTDVAHKPGLLRGLTDRLAQAGIDLHHLSATTTASQERCPVVFASANNDRAVVVPND